MKSEYYGVTHCIAICEDCNFELSNHIDLGKLRREINKHIKKTGHTVVMEKGIVIVYKPDESEE